MTKLTTSDLIEIASAHGANVIEQSSFYKIVAPEPNKKAIYVGKSKRTVTRVDFSGFTPEEHDALKLLSEQDAKELNLGAVRGQILTKELDEEVTDDMIRECFQAGLSQVLSEDEGFKLGPKAVNEDENETEEESSEDDESEDDSVEAEDDSVEVELEETDDEIEALA